MVNHQVSCIICHAYSLQSNICPVSYVDPAKYCVLYLMNVDATLLLHVSCVNATIDILYLVSVHRLSYEIILLFDEMSFLYLLRFISYSG